MKLKECLKFASYFSYVANEYQCDAYQGPHNLTKTD